MRKIKYILKIFKNINFKKLKETTKIISKKTGKNIFIVLFDIIYCAIKYGTGYNDYLHFGFYNLNKQERQTYITRVINNKLVAKLNDKNDIYKLDSKKEFNKLYNKYLKREWFYLTNNNYEEFKNWCQNKKEIIVKPDGGTGGKGIEKFIIDDNTNYQDLFNYLVGRQLLLIEEVIIQKEYLNKIYDKSINTLRIITFTNNGKTEVLTAFLRVGNGGIVDNTCSGGMVIPIDIKTGETVFPGIDLFENVFYEHPLTKEKLVGIKIYDWEDCIKLVNEASLVTQTIRYNAWDVAISKHGPCLVEGNPYPGYYYQFPLFLPNKIGFLPRIYEILDELDLKKVLK